MVKGRNVSGYVKNGKRKKFYCATIAYHVGLNALLVATRHYDQRLRKKDMYTWP